MAAALLFCSAQVGAAILVEIPALPKDSKGDSTIEGWLEMIQASSLSFGVDHELLDGGVKGGTGDLGLAEFEQVNIEKSLDVSSTHLFQYSVTGTNIGTVIIHFIQSSGNGNAEYLQVKLDGVVVKSWSTSGDGEDRPTEDVNFVFNKIAWQFASTKDGMTFTPGFIGSWDRLANKVWDSPNIVMRTK